MILGRTKNQNLEIRTHDRLVLNVPHYHCAKETHRNIRDEQGIVREISSKTQIATVCSCSRVTD
jgi:hypothetical protein